MVNKKILMIIFLVFISGCSSAKNNNGDYNMEYDKYIEKTSPMKNKTLVEGSKEEQKAIDDFKNFYKVFSYEVIDKNIEKIYSKNAYFRDGYKEVTGIKDIKDYFLKSAKTVHECRFDIHDVAVDKGEYYVRWTMYLRLERKKDELIKAPGMSHLRFDEKGMIVFHQDYWDSSLVFERLPVIGFVLRWIKSRF